MSTMVPCAIEGCDARATAVFSTLPFHNGKPLTVCAAHARMIREQGIAGAMADPEVRARLGLPATDDEQQQEVRPWT